MPELSELIAQRDSVMAEISGIDSQSKDDINRILEAIKSQRWYFFRNNKYILMDKFTGLLWPNLDYYNYQGGQRDNFDNIGGYDGWQLPTDYNMRILIDDKTFPFCEGDNHHIKKQSDWHTDIGRIELGNCKTS